MNKINQLFIRACKSKDPGKRLKSIRRRFYIRLHNDNKFILIKLAELCDEYSPIKGTKLIEELLHPFVMRESSLEDKLLHIYLNQIRFTEVKSFPGLTPPAMFRK